MFDVYDTVWVIDKNSVTSKIVHSVIKYMTDTANGFEYLYCLIDNKVSKIDDNPIFYNEEDLFLTKEDLIDSL